MTSVNRLKRFVTALGVVLSASHAVLAQEALVVFGNGIWNDREKAERARQVLEDAVRSSPIFDGWDLSFDLAYNHTQCEPESDPGFFQGGCLADVREAVMQAAADVGLLIDESTFWSYLAQLQTDFDAGLDFSVETAMSTIPFEGPTIFEEDLARHVVVYKNAIASGKRVLLIAHSQGNFFGNQAGQLLTPQERASFGMVSVATPTDNVLGDFDSETAPYVTLEEDPIHKLPFAFDSRTGNFPEGYGGDPQWQYHDFTNWYARAGNDSRFAIQLLGHYVLDGLADPLSACSSYTVAYSQLSQLYYLVQSTGEIRWIDPGRPIPVGGSIGFTGVANPYGLLYDQCRDRLYTADATETLYELDPDDGFVTNTTQMTFTWADGESSLGVFHLVDMTLAPDGKVYALFKTTNALYKSFLGTLDLDTGEVEEVSRLGRRYSGFTYHPASDTYYVSDSISPGRLSRIGVPGAVGGGPLGTGSPGPGILAMSPDPSRGPADLLVALSKSFPTDSTRVRRFDLNSMSVGDGVASISSMQSDGTGMTLGPPVP